MCCLQTLSSVVRKLAQKGSKELNTRRREGRCDIPVLPYAFLITVVSDVAEGLLHLGLRGIQHGGLTQDSILLERMASKPSLYKAVLGGCGSVVVGSADSDTTKQVCTEPIITLRGTYVWFPLSSPASLFTLSVCDHDVRVLGVGVGCARSRWLDTGIALERW
jgi:hypothetical protein